MKNHDFQHRPDQSTQQTRNQQHIDSCLSDVVDQQIAKEQLSEISNCPHCSSSTFVRWGQANDEPRYRCKSCLKTFNALTGTPLARLHHKTIKQQVALELIKIFNSASTTAFADEPTHCT